MSNLDLINYEWPWFFLCNDYLVSLLVSFYLGGDECGDEDAIYWLFINLSKPFIYIRKVKIKAINLLLIIINDLGQIRKYYDVEGGIIFIRIYLIIN